MLTNSLAFQGAQMRNSMMGQLFLGLVLLYFSVLIFQNMLPLKNDTLPSYHLDVLLSTCKDNHTLMTSRALGGLEL